MRSVELKDTETFCRAREKLEQTEKGLCIVNVKKGCGKDWLILSFLEDKKDCSIYLRLEEEFTQLKKFILWVTNKINGQEKLALQIHDIVPEDDLSCVMAEYIIGVWKDTLLNPDSGTRILVIDGLEYIKERKILDFINYFTETVRDSMKIILCMSSNVLQNCGFYHALQGGAVCISTKDLMLSQNDIRLLVDSLFSGREAFVQKNMTDRLYEYFGGWPFGMKYALELLEAENGLVDEEALWSRENYPVCQEYICEYLFWDTPLDVRNFLYKIYQLKDINASECDKYLGISWSKGYLENLYQEGLLLKAADTTGRYWVCGLLKEYLGNCFQHSERCSPLEKGKEGMEKGYITSFGEFGITYQGKKPSWRTKKVKELFAFLFSKQGKPVTKEAITENLWPEYEEKKASRIFYTTMSYLRRNLDDIGMKKLIATRNQQYFMDSSFYYSDYELMMEIKKAIEKKQWDRILQLPDIMEIYKGSFLEFCSEEWCYSSQAHLEQICLKCLRIMGNHEMLKENYQKALEYFLFYQRINAYTEDINLAIIKCYAMLKDYQRVRYSYLEVRRIYEKELGIMVPGEIKIIYEQCIAANGDNMPEIDGKKEGKNKK